MLNLPQPRPWPFPVGSGQVTLGLENVGEALMAVTGGRFPIWRGPLQAVLVIAWLPAVLTAMAGPSVAAASGPALSSSPRSLTWRSPVPGPLRVARPFQPPPSRYAAGHRGVDLTASAGTVVTAAGDGVVGFAGILAGRGVVTVVHGTLRRRTNRSTSRWSPVSGCARVIGSAR